MQLKKASQLIKEVKVKKTSQWQDNFEVVKYDDQLKEIDYTQGYSLEASTPNGYTLVKSGYDKQANSYVLQYRNNKLDLVHHDHNHSMTNAIPNTADNNRSSFVFMFGLSFIAYLSLLLWRFYKRS